MVGTWSEQGGTKSWFLLGKCAALYRGWVKNVTNNRPELADRKIKSFYL